ncbi:MAG: class 3 adenylate cyclase [Alphaproteobacteria bacterium]|jgi:class 3 adenylate cyclase
MLLQTKWQTNYSLLQREHIILRICQAMIVVILLQSIKLTGAPPFYSPISPHTLLLHIANTCVHLLLFVHVLLLLKRKAGKSAKLLLLISFYSYILVACWLWHYNVNLEYYFLLSMFISCYIFDHHEHIALGFTIILQLALFVIMHQQTPIETLSTTIHNTTEEVAYLSGIAQINTWVFGLSCVVCALFVRNILGNNWQQLKEYEATQSRLLRKLFPAQLVPPLLSLLTNDSAKMSSIYNANLPRDDASSMQNCFAMGVVFLDIVDFTTLTSMGHDDSTPLNWQSIYGLFTAYDHAVEAFDAKRIKTNGDQYILLLGFQSEHEPNSTIALQLIKACRQLLSSSTVDIRIGAAFGPITCGVFDPNNPNFDIWGETVIRAARLEKIAQPNQIVVDEALYKATAQYFAYEPPCLHNLKGLGEQSVYPLQSADTKR